jgi:predicted small integral membrane protein
MEARLKSRCAGLLELKSQSDRDAHRSQRENTKDMTYPTTHINFEPIVQFIHLTAKDFLQQEAVQTVLRAKIRKRDDDINVSLLGACILRLKWIGLTQDFQDAWGAIHDALYYAKQAELSTGTAQTDLLDNLDRTMSNVFLEQWPSDCQDTQNYSTNHWTKDRFLGHSWHWVVLEPQEQGGKQYAPGDNFLSYAVHASLTLYLKTKLPELKKQEDANWTRHCLKYDPMSHYRRVIPMCVFLKALYPHNLLWDLSHLAKSASETHEKQFRRPLLYLAVAPRDPPSLLYYSSANGDRLSVEQADSTTVQLLLEQGSSPNEMLGHATIWEHMLSWNPKRRHSDGCRHDSRFMDVLRVMLEHGADPMAKGRHGGHDCSLLFMATTCADIRTQQRQELIDLLLEKGAKLLPHERSELFKLAPWTKDQHWQTPKTNLLPPLAPPRRVGERHRDRVTLMKRTLSFSDLLYRIEQLRLPDEVLSNSGTTDAPPQYPNKRYRQSGNFKWFLGLQTIAT